MFSPKGPIILSYNSLSFHSHDGTEIVNGQALNLTITTHVEQLAQKLEMKEMQVSRNSETRFSVEGREVVQSIISLCLIMEISSTHTMVTPHFNTTPCPVTLHLHNRITPRKM